MREPALGSDGPLAEESGVWEADTAKEPVAFSSVMPDGSVLGPVRRSHAVLRHLGKQAADASLAHLFLEALLAFS